MEQFKFKMIPVPAEALEAVGLIPGTMAEGFVEGNPYYHSKKRMTMMTASAILSTRTAKGVPLLSRMRRMPKEQIDEYIREDDEND